MPIIIESHPLSESTWVESTYPTHMDDSVGPADNFVVTFTKAVSVASLVVDHFKIYDAVVGDELVGAFRDVAAHNDYDDLNLTLTLHLSAALDPNHEYTFVIDGLYDAVGNDQDIPHAVTFTTEDVVAVVPPEVTEESVIAAENHSIANADILIDDEAQAGSSGHTAYMDPTDGAYNVAADTDVIYVTFSPNDVTAATATVTRRQIAWQETSWETIGVTTDIDAAAPPTGTSGKLEITMPAVSTDVYLEPGYEYKFVVHATQKTVGGTPSAIDETFEFEIMGELEYMFTSVSSVLMQYPGWASYDVARLIYINSARAIALDSGQTNTLTRAGEDYVLYSTLWRLSLIGSSDSAMVMLGDLQVQSAQATGNTGLSGKWEELMNRAEARLARVGPRWARKGSGYASPFSTRDWDDAISPASGTYTGIGTGAQGNKPRISLTD